MKLSLLTLVLCLCPALTLRSQTAAPEDNESTACLSLPGLSRDATRSTAFVGVGRNHLYDSYLSPLDYSGLTLGFGRMQERQKSWAQGRITSLLRWSLKGTRAQTGNGKGQLWDGEVELTYGGHYNRLFSPFNNASTLRLGAGVLMGGHVGGTYSTRNGNNPAQGRVAVEGALSGVADYRFRLLSRQWQWRTLVEVPVAGLMFSPQYGQSYYEIFELGHYNHNLRFTHPFNAPSICIFSTLSLPFAHRRFSIGVDADIRQSQVNGLKRHAWNTMLVIGYTRTIKLFDR